MYTFNFKDNENNTIPFTYDDISKTVSVADGDLIPAQLTHTIYINYLGEVTTPFTMILDLVPLVLISLLLGVLYFDIRNDENE